MPTYRAGRGGGAFGSFAYPDTRPRIDVAPILDAAMGGASSLIQNAYLRKRADAEFALRNQQLELERQRTQREQENMESERDYRNRALAQKEESERRQAVTSGYVPGGTTLDTTPNTLDITSGFKAPTSIPFNPGQTPPAGGDNSATPMTATSAVQRAMMQSVQTPQVGTPPQQPAQAAPVAPPNRLKVTPPSYDMNRDRTYLREKSMLDARDADIAARQGASFAHQDTLEETRQKNRVALRNIGDRAAMARTQWNTSHRAPKGGSGASGLTPNQERNYWTKVAGGMIQQHGDLQSVLDWYNSPQSQKSRDAGMKETDITAAYKGVPRDPLTNDIIRLEAGGAFDFNGALQAATSARNAGAAIRGNTPPPGPIKSPTAPATTKPAAGSKPPAVAPTPYTDDEVAAAMAAGAKSEDEVHAFVAKTRKPKIPAGTTPPIVPEDDQEE